MCGRYNIIDDPFTRALMEQLGITTGLTTRHNIAPTETVPVVYQQDSQRLCQDMRWWLVPSWSDGPSTKYAMFNARSESVASNRAFRGPFKRQRAIIPASSFIEWQRQGGGKNPYQIQPRESAFAFAGLWDLWRDGEQRLYSCTMVTCAALPQFAHIHKRMPVMLEAADFDRWLDPKIEGEQLADLPVPGLPRALEVFAVDPEINNARNKVATRPSAGMEIIAPE